MFKRRTLTVAGLVVAIFTPVIFQLINVQWIQHSYYQRRAENTILRAEVIHPLRGQIRDRNGHPLARNRREYDLYVVPNHISDPEQLFGKIASMTSYSRETFIQAYESLLQQIDRRANRQETERARERIREGERARDHRLVSHLSFEEARHIRLAKDELRGALVRSWPTREYPEEYPMGHVTGYVQAFLAGQDGEPSEYEQMEEAGFFRRNLAEDVGDDLYQQVERRGEFRRGVLGRAGIENAMDARLRGAYGIRVVERNTLTGSTREIHSAPARNGENVQLTLSTSFQEKAYEVMEDRKGALIVQDTDNAELLALAGNPTYNPNRLIPPVSQQDQKDIFGGSSESTTFDRAITGQYPPGSSFKIAVALAALEEGTITPSTEWECNGTYETGNHTFECWIYGEAGIGHGPLTVTEALRRSCNIFFYKTGRALGGKHLRKWAQKFGFGSGTTLELPDESNGQLFEPWEVINVAIGQGSFLVTPLQLNQLITALASGSGKPYPTLVRGPVQNREQSFESLDIAREHYETVRQGLYETVNEEDGGTAYRTESLRDLPYRVAGKTGTIQVPGGRETHAVFVGYAPAEDPEIAFTFFYEHGGSGGADAAPVIGDFLHAIEMPDD